MNTAILKLSVSSKRTTTITLLPANEVWGKVICLHLSVILFTGGSGPGEVPGPWVCLVPGGCLVLGGAWSGGCLVWRVPGPGGLPGGDSPRQLQVQAVYILLECILVIICKFINY